MPSNPQRGKTLYLVKGSRFDDAHPILSTDVVVRNRLKGVETCLMLDLNVLADMEDVVFGRKNLEETGLDKAVFILNNTLGLILAPGFGLGEVSTKYLPSRVAGFDRFLEMHCPTYRDTPNSTTRSVEERIKRGVVCGTFSDLPDDRKFVLAPFYANMLKMRLLTFEEDRQPIEKFCDMVRFQHEELNQFTLVPLELAKYAFCRVSTIKQASFREFCARVRKIIVKDRPKSPGGLSKKCLNASWDIYYYLVSGGSNSSLITLDGYKQDLWILTGDEGLACLSDAIYYDAAFPPMRVNRYGRVPHRNEYIYFRQCDRLVEITGEKRRRPSAEFDYEKVVENSLGAIARCEQQAALLLNKTQNTVERP